MADTRSEKDPLGMLDVPSGALYGVQTLRARQNFPISGLRPLDAFIDSQVLIPGKWQPVPPEQLRSNTLKSQLLQKIHENLETYKESI